MKDVQCYELFGGIALKNHAFSYFFSTDRTEERKAGALSDRERGKTATRVQGSVWHDGN